MSGGASGRPKRWTTHPGLGRRRRLLPTSPERTLMEFAKNFTRVSALALGITAALAYGDVHAAAFQLKENSVKAQGRAMAGAASAKGDASVVVNNPAVMSTFTERTLQADVTAIDLSYEFTGGGTAATGT